MSDYKNIKVEINKEQILDELLRELERLGYKTLNKFRLCLREREKSGIIESVVENVALPYWRLK